MNFETFDPPVSNLNTHISSLSRHSYFKSVRACPCGSGYPLQVLTPPHMPRFVAGFPLLSLTRAGQQHPSVARTIPRFFGRALAWLGVGLSASSPHATAHTTLRCGLSASIPHAGGATTSASGKNNSEILWACLCLVRGRAIRCKSSRHRTHHASLRAFRSYPSRGRYGSGRLSASGPHACWSVTTPTRGSAPEPSFRTLLNVSI
jgi:hypothetical protein